MGRKKMAFEEEGSAIGHNSGASDANRVKYTEQYLAVKAKMRKLKDEEKAILNKAKDEGILKTSIRNAAKDIDGGEDAYRSKQEIAVETRRIIELFAEKGGQYSFLQPVETEEAA